MDLLISGVLSGVAVGLLYGLLGFAIVVLYKCTSIANFAQGNLGAIAAFAAYELTTSAGLPVAVAIVLGAACGIAAGILAYALVIRVRPDAGHLNVTIRTLGIYLLLLSVMNVIWGQRQPLTFPKIFPEGVAFTVAELNVSWLTLGTLGVAAALALSFAALFRTTNIGLMFLALAENPSVAALLGVKTGRLTMLAWGTSALVSFIVAMLIVPVANLSSEMMDLYLLLAFTGAIIGGLTSLFGPFLGGALVGVVYNVATIYWNRDIAVFSVFALLLAVMMVRPNGILGRRRTERL
jgi:branched-chain amino acid transport system permease protein